MSLLLWGASSERKQVLFYFTPQRELVVAVWVNGWLLSYFLYFSMFEIFHHFEKEPRLPAWSFRWEQNPCCSKLSQVLCDLIPPPDGPLCHFSATVTQAALGLSTSYLRSLSRLMTWSPLSNCEGQKTVFNSPSNTVFSCLEKAWEGLDTTVPVQHWTHPGGLCHYGGLLVKGEFRPSADWVQTMSRQSRIQLVGI